MVFNIMRMGGGCEAGERTSLLIRIAREASKISIHLPLCLEGGMFLQLRMPHSV